MNRMQSVSRSNPGVGGFWPIDHFRPFRCWKIRLPSKSCWHIVPDSVWMPREDIAYSWPNFRQHKWNSSLSP